VNAGEESEYYLKSYMLRQRDLGKKDTIFGRINELSDDGNLESLKWDVMAEDDLANFRIENLITILRISKSGVKSKADISINGVRYSIKEVGASPPAIINHTPRPGFENVCKNLNVSIQELDDIVREYWDLRTKVTIKEDTCVSDTNCPFTQHKRYLRPIIEYFVFTGTGTGDSKYLADKILEIDYKSLPVEMKIVEKEQYFDDVWQRLVFSLRSKGMPPNYPKTKNSNSISKWTRFFDGKNKGSLHVRVKTN